MDKVMTRLWWLAVLLVSCTKPNPSATCSNGTCSNPDYPYCDADGAVGGEPNTCLAVSCTPGDFGVCDGSAAALMCNAAGNGYDAQQCDHACQDGIGCIACAPNTSACVGNTIQECGADGRVAKLTTCALSCVADPAPHCAYISPRYLPDICDATATDAELHITSSGTIDTDAQTSCNGGVVAQSTGPSICVMRYGTISIDAGATLSFIDSASQLGVAGNLLAMVADSDLTIHGTLDVGARNGVSGPGGGSYSSGGGPAGTGTGGGGAGFKTAGAAGGNATTDGGAQNAGAASTMDPSTLAILTGGPSGGNSGAGGGAAMLVSCRGSVVVDGKLTSGGGGGLGGYKLGIYTFGGGGGGAGGYIVLQGLGVRVTGSVYANGGGGGAGYGPSNGQPGSDGTAQLTPASGGTSSSAGSGGTGAVLTQGPSVGLHATSTGNAGGGGGGLGFFQSYTPSNVSPDLRPAEASPGFQPNGVVPTR